MNLPTTTRAAVPETPALPDLARGARHGSLALLADLWQLTMAYGYVKSGTADREAVFHRFFRSHPFQGGFTVHGVVRSAAGTRVSRAVALGAG